MKSGEEIRARMRQRKRKAIIRKTLIKTGIILFLIMIVLIYCTWRTNKENEKIEQSEQTQIEIEKNDNETTIEASAPVENSPQNSDWRLILVNKDNEIPENYQVELANIDPKLQFDKRAIGELNAMMTDMRKSGISYVWIQSAYRDEKLQTELYKNSVKKYMKQGMTEEEAEIKTQKSINKPNTSEHNLGLSIDFNEVTEGFANTKAYQWLMKNAENYGFILRYPKEKEDITGVIYEPWHWRYVGKENAIQMNEKNECLEEFVR